MIAMARMLSHRKGLRNFLKKLLDSIFILFGVCDGDPSTSSERMVRIIMQRYDKTA